MFQVCIERMLNLTDHLRRLKVDKYEYVAMKVIVLLSSGELLLVVQQTGAAKKFHTCMIFRYGRTEGT